MHSDLNIALLPMQIVWGMKNLNMDSLREAMLRIHPATDLLILPETFSTGFPAGMDIGMVRSMAEPCDGATMRSLRELSSAHNVAVCGSVIAEDSGELFNRAFFVEPSGETTFADKRHLFTMAGEHHVFSPGTRRLTVRYRGWNISMVICYDLRFPVWCRNTGSGYDLLIVVANWPQVRINAWKRLIPARAIENLAYVAAVDCKGTDSKGFVYDGSSSVVDFKGDEISVPDHIGNIVYASLSKERLETFREKFPAHLDADTFTLI